LDVAIIGAGPIGLELAVGLKQARVQALHFDAGQIGQTVSWFPKMIRFFSSADRIAISGVPLHTSDQSKVTREEYLTYLRGIVEQFDLDIHTYERVIDIKKSLQGFTLTTDRGGAHQRYTVSNLVLAVGDMARPRLLHIPGEDLEQVSHYLNETHKYFRKQVLIVGGGNSAVEAAIRCHRAGAKVSISYRRDRFDDTRIKYWLLPEIRSLIKTQQMTFYPNTVPRSIRVGQVTLFPSSGHIADPLDVTANFVLLLTGYVMDTGLFEMAGVTMEGENHAPVFDPKTMQTDVPNVYVAGTAAAGTQERFRLFIENCHVHVPRIVASITGQPPPAELDAAANNAPELES